MRIAIAIIKVIGRMVVGVFAAWAGIARTIR